MPRKPPPTSRIELLQGTLDFIILQTLRWGPCHGYGMVQMIRAQSDDALQVETGSLYPALQRLLRQGAIAAEWGVSGSDRGVRRYHLTPKGRARLAAERSRWEQLTDAIAGLMHPPAAARRGGPGGRDGRVARDGGSAVRGEPDRSAHVRRRRRGASRDCFAAKGGSQ